MLAFVRQRWFLMTLIAVLWTGMAWPGRIGPLIHGLPSDLVVALVTFVMALPLETSALWRAARRPGPAWLAVALNSGLAPPLGWLASRILTAELAIGVIVATTVPCTLATAAVWTRRARGNDAVAFLVTIITNMLCFVVVPAWLWLLAGTDVQADISRAEIDYGRIAFGLILLVVLPIIAAQLLRQLSAVATWASRQKEVLSYIAQCGVLVMVLIGAVKCGEQLGVATSETILTAQRDADDTSGRCRSCHAVGSGIWPLKVAAVSPGGCDCGGLFGQSKNNDGWRVPRFSGGAAGDFADGRVPRRATGDRYPNRRPSATAA